MSKTISFLEAVKLNRPRSIKVGTFVMGPDQQKSWVVDEIDGDNVTVSDSDGESKVFQIGDLDVVSEAVGDDFVDLPANRGTLQARQVRPVEDGIVDQVGKFYVVDKATENSAPEDVAPYEVDVWRFANMVRGGLTKEDVYGIFTDQQAAQNAADTQLRLRDTTQEI